MSDDKPVTLLDLADMKPVTTKLLKAVRTIVSHFETGETVVVAVNDVLNADATISVGVDFSQAYNGGLTCVKSPRTSKTLAL